MATESLPLLESIDDENENDEPNCELEMGCESDSSYIGFEESTAIDEDAGCSPGLDDYFRSIQSKVIDGSLPQASRTLGDACHNSG